jgi:hypothetical protein
MRASERMESEVKVNILETVEKDRRLVLLMKFAACVCYIS